MTTTTNLAAAIIPMRYEALDVTSLDRLIDDPNIALEQKIDGIRVAARIIDGHVTWAASNGGRLASTTALKQLAGIDTLLEACGFSGQWVLDGEIVDGTLWLFDLPLGLDGAVTPRTPFAQRRDALELLAGALEPAWGDRIRIVPCHRTPTAKRSLWEAVVAAGAEGVCAKRLDGQYLASGRKRSRDVLKVKITYTVDCVVVARNTTSACNAELAVTGPDGTLVPVGSTSMIGKPDAAVGDVVEVRCLYVQPPAKDRPLGTLYQPTLLRIRDDKTPGECQADQFVYPDRTVLDTDSLCA